MKDLYELLADVLRDHRLYEYSWGTEEDCSCDHHDSKDHATHVAQVIGDLLIDLAGHGQLLASINRIAR